MNNQTIIASLVSITSILVILSIVRFYLLESKKARLKNMKEALPLVISIIEQMFKNAHCCCIRFELYGENKIRIWYDDVYFKDVRKESRSNQYIDLLINVKVNSYISTLRDLYMKMYAGNYDGPLTANISSISLLYGPSDYNHVLKQVKFALDSYL